jgi:hypothetical protein
VAWVLQALNCVRSPAASGSQTVSGVSISLTDAASAFRWRGFRNCQPQTLLLGVTGSCSATARGSTGPQRTPVIAVGHDDVSATS